MNQGNTTGEEPAMPAPGARNLQHLLERDDLSRERKVEILRQWEQDLRELMVAEEENMPASSAPDISLDEVLNALHQLGAQSDSHPVPTRHG
jgi:hypothetical protein